MNGANDRQIEDLKRLMIVLLVKLGATSDEIALALQVDASRVRQMMPVSKIHKLVGDDTQGSSKNTRKR